MATLVEQEVFQTLSVRILPCILASMRPTPFPLKAAAWVNFYCTEVASALVGWGIMTGPVSNVVAGKAVEASSWAGSNGALVVMGVGWTTFTLWSKRGRVSEKIALQASCQAAFRDINDECENILQNERQPNKSLIQLATRVTEAKKHHRDGFMVEPSSPSVIDEATKKAAELVARYNGLWVDQLGSPSADPSAISNPSGGQP